MDISIIKNAVDDKFIQSIIDVGESQKLEEASIGGKSNTSNNIRSTKISWIMDKTILLTLKDKMLEINKSKNWNYDVTDMFPFQYSVYHENDHYDWHVDTGSAYLKQKERKISFSLILNDNYEGGELEFKNSDENISLDLNKGDMVTFPSFLEHRVKPVLNGTRISLVGWMLGPC
jgi:PKHD-type hydroxylase